MNEKIEEVLWSFIIMVLSTAALVYMAYSIIEKPSKTEESETVEQSVIEITKVEK